MSPDESAKQLEPVVSRCAEPPLDDVQQWIASARAGCTQSLGLLAERCRQYLLLIANHELGDYLRCKVGASDVVQETLLTAQQAIVRFDGKNETQLRLWLRAILLHKLAHASRSFSHVAKRDIHREQQLDDANGWNDELNLVDQSPTPRQNAIANEQVLAIERTIEKLPAHYQQVIRLRCFDLRTFVEIGQLLQTSSEAARKLWCRAVEVLLREWEANDESR
jgi:RNA polymerase sigma-70 factor (ECF subfamily)